MKKKKAGPARRTAAADDPRFAALVATLKKEARFKAIVAAYEQARASAKGSFGRNALRADGKIFAMMTEGQLVLKLPQARVEALIKNGDGAPFDANKGKAMKEWVTIRHESRLAWSDLAREAHDFVSS